VSGAEIGGLVLGGIGAATGIAALVQNQLRGRESDRIQERLAAVEEARRRDELRPGLTMTAVDNESRVLTIRNGDRIELDHVEIVEAIEAPPVIARGIKSCTGAYFGLRMGEAMTVRVSADENVDGGLLVLNLAVRSGSDTWDVSVRCEVPNSHQWTAIGRLR
jgi:hypothetical protein